MKINSDKVVKKLQQAIKEKEQELKEVFDNDCPVCFVGHIKDEIKYLKDFLGDKNE